MLWRYVQYPKPGIHLHLSPSRGTYTQSAWLGYKLLTVYNPLNSPTVFTSKDINSGSLLIQTAMLFGTLILGFLTFALPVTAAPGACTGACWTHDPVSSPSSGSSSFTH